MLKILSLLIKKKVFLYKLGLIFSTQISLAISCLSMVKFGFLNEIAVTNIDLLVTDAIDDSLIKASAFIILVGQSLAF